MKRSTFLVFVLFVPACAGSASVDGRDAGPDAGLHPDASQPEPVGDHYRFVLSDIRVPRNKTEGSMYGLDIDGAGEIDNRFATIVQTLSQFSSSDPQEVMDLLIARGEVLMLADLQATSLQDADDAGLWMFPGVADTPTPCEDFSDTTCGRHLDGGGTFEVAVDDADEALLFGEISSSHVSSGPGTITLEFPFVIVPGVFSLQLHGVRVEADVNPDGTLSGKLGGAASVESLENDFLPQLVDVMNDLISVDCSGAAPSCCPSGTKGALLIDLFDTDASCDLALEEVQESTLVQQLMAPDVDLFNEEGFQEWNGDGVLDSVSFGLRFDSVPASFPFVPSP